MEKATQAREENIIANELEQIKLAITNAMAQGLDGKVSDVNLKNALQGIIDNEELEKITGDGPWTIKTKLGKTYEINGYGQIEETVVLEPTDIYVALDGTTLRFYNNKDNVPQNLLSNLYSYENETENFKGVDFTEANKNPWYNDKTNITRASIEDIIVPTSTARWFNETAITGIDNIENLKTSCVTNMGRMFRNCSNIIELDVSKFDTRNVTNMTTMFQNCSKLTQLDVSKFKTDNVTDMSYMFFGCSGLTQLDVSKFKTENVENMEGMFGGINVIMKFSSLDVSKFDTRNVTSMSAMFQNCTKLTELDLSNWDTSKVTNMNYFLNGYMEQNKITTIYVGDKWNTDVVTNSLQMFYNCSNLVGGQGTTYSSNYLDKTRAKVDGGSSSPGYFTHINDKVTN